LTKTKARISRRQTRADLERQLKACRGEIANARERLIEATKQQTATSEMLRIISDSPLQSVLDAVAETCRTPVRREQCGDLPLAEQPSSLGGFIRGNSGAYSSP